MSRISSRLCMTMAAAALLMVARPAAAQFGVKPDVDDKAVKEAVRKGVAFLKNDYRQSPALRVGAAALTGLALLEAGAGPKDTTVQYIATRLRTERLPISRTYDLALTILFLDRLGDKRDAKLIRSCALRLVAGQNDNGGWSYTCPVLTTLQEEQLLTFLRKNQPLRDPLRPIEHAFLVPLDKLPAAPLVASLPQDQPSLNATLPAPEAPLPAPLTKKSAADLLLTIPAPKDVPDRKPPPGPEPPARGPETGAATQKPVGAAQDKKPLAPAKENDAADAKQPAAVAPGKPGKPAPHREPLRVDPADWPSVPQFVRKNFGKDRLMLPFNAGKLNIDDNSNTQFAILALWAARRHNVPMALSLGLLDRRFRSSQRPDGCWSYHLHSAHRLDTMTCVGLLGLGVSHGSFRETMKLDPKQALGDPAVQRGMAALAQFVGLPHDRNVNIYLLWSVERVAMLYDLKEIGGHDWYAWGASALLQEQRADGGWHTRGYFGSQPPHDTAMAILFLTRSHLNRDLTDRLKGFVQTRQK